MNKKFFQMMKTFATVLLVLGLIGAAVLLFTIVIVSGVDKYGDSTTSFSASGLVNTIIVALGVVGGYFLLSGVARVGLAAYAEETGLPLPQKRILIAGSYSVGKEIAGGDYYVYQTRLAGDKDQPEIGKIIVKNENGIVLAERELSQKTTLCSLKSGMTVCVTTTVRMEAVVKDEEKK